jgi:hypothetical protein
MMKKQVIPKAMAVPRGRMTVGCDWGNGEVRRSGRSGKREGQVREGVLLSNLQFSWYTCGTIRIHYSMGATTDAFMHRVVPYSGVPTNSMPLCIELSLTEVSPLTACLYA